MNIFDFLVTLIASLICFTGVALLIFTLKWYSNRDISVSIRKYLNWALPFLISVGLYPLTLLEAAETKTDVIVLFAFSIVCYIILSALIVITYSGKWKDINKQEKKGVISVCPRFEMPSRKQIDEEIEFQSLTDEEKQKWYNEYCRNNKYINPYLALSIYTIVFWGTAIFVLLEVT